MRAVRILAAVGLVFLVVLLTAAPGLRPASAAGQADSEISAFVCPMHPDYTLDIAGTCPRCGMALVRATPFDVRDYRLDFTTTPAVVKPGERATLRFRAFHPGSDAPVTRFELVHERPYHLFVISQDLSFFQHIHPQMSADGTWTIDVTLPKPGSYKLLSDFLPGGGSWQFLARPLVTAGYKGDLFADSATLVADTSPINVDGDLTARARTWSTTSTRIRSTSCPAPATTTARRSS
jgi:hypothetical protein